MRQLAIALLIAASLAWCQQTKREPERNAAASAAPGNRALASLAHATTDERIQAYERMLAASPGDFQLEAGLIATYLQKMRESGDGTYLDRASKLVNKMLERDGGNFIALRFQNEIDLQRHDFRGVAERASSMTKYAQSDAGSWGNLGDALMELGQYERAGEAYLRMFSLRPDLGSYNRLAYFRFVTGDAQQAKSLMSDAIAAGDPQPENVAWCWAELGDMEFKTGHLEDAARAYRSALALFPTLHRASAGLGRVEAATGHIEASVKYYERAQSIVPLVEYAAALEDLYAAAGLPNKAREQEALISAIEKLGMAAKEKTNRNLALALADHEKDLGFALKLMETEIPDRSDVYTWDALSWVLFKNGRYDEAKAASANALKLGTPEPLFYYHASKIALVSGDKRAAQDYSERLLSLNPKFDLAKRDMSDPFFVGPRR